MYGLVLIAVLAVMGGVIAYIGDKLGSKVGKRKLTIFGLRPKHTSILVTIVTGIIIAAATLGVLSSASQDVRTALFGMEELKTKLVSLTKEVNSKNSELEASRLALEEKTKEYTALTAKIKETTNALTKVKNELASVTAERDRTAAALAKLQADYNSAKVDLDKARQEIKELQATKNALDTKVAALNSEKITLQGDIDKLNKVIETLRVKMINVREGQVIFRAGEVLSVAVLRGGRPSSENVQALGEFISATNQSILKRLGINDKNLEVLWIAQADVDRTVAFLAENQNDQIVRLSAQGNIIYGEPVIGRIELFPNKLVYPEGTTVYYQSFDTSGNYQSRDIVGEFLQKVNSEAVKHGVLADPLTGEVGTIDIAQLSDIIAKVKHYGGRVELSAVTQKDIYTVGPLKVDIQVRNIQ